MSDWTSVLPSALDGIRYGIVLLDSDFRARFINRAYYGMWALPPPPPGVTYHLDDLIAHARNAGLYNVGSEAMDEYIRERRALIRAGSEAPSLLRLSNGKIFNFQSQILPDGGRMLTFDDITALVGVADRLRVLATVDDLTKFLNRRQFLDSFETEFKRAQSHGCPLSVMMIDADDFKRINDRHGHAAGDNVLRAMAERCRAVVRKGDIVGRLGGEEFAIVLVDTDLSDAVPTAERLRRTVADESFRVDGDSLRLTVSIGIAALNPQQEDPDDLLRLADRALYAAKDRGRNCIVTDTDHG
jgi:diguanylate cyclase (GGDEF)-like protein